MFKIRKNLFETNSSSTHSLTVRKIGDDGKIEYGSHIVLKEAMLGKSAYTEKEKLQFISCVLTSLVEMYYDETGESYNCDISELFFNNPAFLTLKEVLKEERNVELEYQGKNTYMLGNDDYGNFAWDILFGDFNWHPEDDLRERSLEYCKDMKSKIKEYIFDNYILSSEDEEW